MNYKAILWFEWVFLNLHLPRIVFTLSWFWCVFFFSYTDWLFTYYCAFYQFFGCFFFRLRNINLFKDMVLSYVLRKCSRRKYPFCVLQEQNLPTAILLHTMYLDKYIRAILNEIFREIKWKCGFCYLTLVGNVIIKWFFSIFHINVF